MLSLKKWFYRYNLLNARNITVIEQISDDVHTWKNHLSRDVLFNFGYYDQKRVYVICAFITINYSLKSTLTINFHISIFDKAIPACTVLTFAKK